MNYKSRDLNLVINLAIIISLLFSTILTTPASANSIKSSDQNQNQFLSWFSFLNNRQNEKYEVSPQRSLRSNQIGLVSQVANNLSIERTYTSVDCLQNTDLIIANGEACTLDAGAYEFVSITIQSGGALIINSNTLTGQGVTINTGELTVASGGLISADGKGFSSATGPGAGQNGIWYQKQPSGAGYGGIGGNGTNGPVGGLSYGDLYQPTVLGSGGGVGNTSAGGAGGGAVKIVVTGTIILNGILSANGANGVSGTFNGGGGGSGGSVWVTANNLSGNGEIQVKGGNGGSSSGYGSAGGGAGGRIAITVPPANNSFTGLFKANGGSGNQIGGAGTVFYTEDNKLVVNNASQTGNKTPLPSSTYEFSKIDLRGKAVVHINGTLSSLSLTSDSLSGDGTGRLEVEGIINTPADFAISGITLAVLNDLVNTENISIQSNATLELTAASPSHQNGTYSFSDISIASTGVLSLKSYDNGDTNYLNDIPFTLNIANLTVQSGGKVSADGGGFVGSKGLGAGTNGTGTYNQGTGASHGGLGGNGYGVNANGPVYGDVYEPFSLGSGGGATASAIGGAGGGALKLSISNSFVLNGILSSNGTNGVTSTYNGSGGGSGGSIWISTTSFSGNGEIQTNGGNGGSSSGYGSGGGGAGGRITIDVVPENNLFNGKVKAYGGSGQQEGGAGTVYYTATDKLVVNSNFQSGNRTELPSSSYAFSKIELLGKAVLRVNGTLSSLSLGNDALLGDGTGRVEVEGSVIAPSDFDFGNSTLAIMNELSGPSNIIVHSGGNLELFASSPTHSDGLFTFNNISIETGGAIGLIPYNNGDTDYSNDKLVTLNVNNLIIQTGGKVTSDGDGYSSASGPGAGISGSGPNNQGSGAGYGGSGGTGSGVGTVGQAYGNVYLPLTLGSGGGASGSTSGGPGGGSVKINVSGVLDLNGTLTANGANGTGGTYNGSGGGSGGSILLNAGSITGNGEIRANGGNGGTTAFYGSGGGGAGGRIAVYSPTLAKTVKIYVNGGSGSQSGQNGSIYLDGVDPILSTISFSPTQLTVSETSQSTVTVTLLNQDGVPVPNKPVELLLTSGNGITVNYQPVSVNQYYLIGHTNSNGVVSAVVSSTKAGSNTFTMRSGQTPINATATVTFVAGEVNPSNSSISSDKYLLKPDGVSTATVTVRALDSFGNPLVGEDIAFNVSGHAMILESSAIIDAQGYATAKIADNTFEKATVTAQVGGSDLGKSIDLQFGSIDLSTTLSAAEKAYSGSDLPYSVKITNTGNTPAENVELTVVLPDKVTYLEDTSGVVPSQTGNTLVWSLGQILGETDLNFTIKTRVFAGVATGETLTANASVSTSSPEATIQNNSAQLSTDVVDPYTFTSSISPLSSSLSIGSSTVYTIHLYNTGLVADTYSLSISDLNSDWYSLSESLVTLMPGAQKDIQLTLEVNGCQSVGEFPFIVSVNSVNSQKVASLSASLSLADVPAVTIDAPDEGAISGSNSVLFSWRTAPATTGTLSIYPIEHPEQVQTYTTSLGTSHQVQISGLVRNQTYKWSINVASNCGTTFTPERTLTIGNGIVFSDHNPKFTIDHDYNQLVDINVLNTDSIVHTLTTTVINPYQDLITNFIDSGSQDQSITLQPGESRTVTLAIHAQDATISNYQITAKLTSESGESMISDNSTIDITVLKSGDFTIIEDEEAFDPVTLGKVYVITNHGSVITDLSLQALTVDGKPANVLIQPSFEHARLETGESIRVTVYPIFTAEDVTPETASIGHFASPKKSATTDFSLQASGGGETRNLSASTGCPAGNNVYPVTMSNCSLEVDKKDWYCTNRPNINTTIDIPGFLNSSTLDSITLKINLTPQSNVLPHSGQYSFNGTNVASFDSSIPSGSYNFSVPLTSLNNGIAGNVSQTITLNTQHPNSGHYVSASDVGLVLGVKQATTYACGASAAAATAAVQRTYGCSTSRGFNPLTDVPNSSVANSGCGGDSECPVATTDSTQGAVGDPINPRTGVFSFTFSDLSFPTLAGDLVLQREYSTEWLNQEDSSLGYGWTFNQDSELIFPTDPGGMEGYVLFKGVRGNTFLFKINQDGTFTPGPGVTSTLTKSNDAEVTYTLLASDQSSFTFNASGQLTARANSKGDSFVYQYDAQNGHLVRVSANNGVRYIDLFYADGRITSVTDHAGREVRYAYNSAGDLISVVDTLGQTWQYQYDDAHRMLKYIDPNGATSVTNEYDMQGRAYKQYDGKGKLVVNIVFNADGSSTVYDALGRAQTFKFDARNTTTDTKNPLGWETNKVYDHNFRPTTIADSDGNSTNLTWSENGANLTNITDAVGNSTSLSYDGFNNITSVEDAKGNQTSFTYDGSFLTSTTDALNQTTTFTYTPEGFLASTTNSNGETTRYTYDAAGQRTSMTDPNGNVWVYAYDDLGHLTSTTDPDGRVSKTEYNAAGWVTRSVTNYDEARSQNEDDIYNITTSYLYDERGNQLSVTDTYGNTTYYEYDLNDRMTQSRDALGNATNYRYDAGGNLIETVDPMGYKTKYTYNANNQVLSTTDALGNVTRTVYNTDGTVARSIDALGRITSYEYDSLQRVTSTTDPAGNVTRSFYDATGNLTSTVAPDGSITAYEYDELNRMVSQTDAEGGSTNSVYDAVGNLSESIDANGNTTSYAYDASGRLVSQTDALGNITRFTYDAQGNRTQVEDPLGRVTFFNYNSLGQQIGTTNAKGNTSSSQFDALGRTVSSTDLLGRTVYFEYDALGRTIKQTDSAGGETTYIYNANGNLISTTDANGHTSTTAYDAAGRMVSQTNANGLTTTYTYDAVGNMLSQKDASGKETRYVYDNLNRQTRVIDPLGNTTNFAYDSRGNLTQKTAANGVVTRYEYDRVGNLLAVVENYTANSSADENTNVRTEYSYDANGNLLTVLDANGNTATTYTYDALNRVVSETNALGVTTSYTYDAAGNRTAMTDGKGQMTSYLFDELNQLVSIDYPGTDADVSFVYDAGGQRTQMTDANGNTVWNYDDLGRATSITDAFDQTVSYSYDAMGNRTSLEYPDGKVVNYNFDAGNRLTRVTDWQSQITSYTYTNNNQVSAIVLPNGVRSNYTYDAAGQLVSIVHTGPEGELSSYRYTYDVVGNRTQAVENVATGMETIPSVNVTVKDTQGGVQAGISVYAYSDTVYTGFNAITDEKGVAKFILPEGHYRFRADKNGLQYYSASQNHCTVLGCTKVNITVPVFTPVTVTVTDSGTVPQAGLPVYVMDGTTFTGFTAITDAQGQAVITLPEGSYRFRVDKNGEMFYSSPSNNCTTPACTSADVHVPQFASVTVTVTDSDGLPQPDLPVYAFNGTTYTGYHAVTNEQGQAVLLIREGEYRFRTDKNNLQYFSSSENHCTVVGCESASITVPVFGQVIVSVTNSAGTAQTGLTVYAFDGDTYKNFSGITDAEGKASLILPEGNYHFQTELNGRHNFSSDQNDCSVPTCATSAILVPQFANVTIQVTDVNGFARAGLPVYAYTGDTYSGYNTISDINGQAVLLLPEGSYRFRSDLNGRQYYSGAGETCTVIACSSDAIVVGELVPTETPTLAPTETPTEAASETPTESPTGFPTEILEATPTLQSLFVPIGKAFLAMAKPHHVLPLVMQQQSGTTVVTVTVADSSTQVQSGLPVYAFDGNTYTGISAITDSNGQVLLSLPAGSYRFRADKNGLQYFSGTANTCTTPDCASASVTVPVFGTTSVMVQDSLGEGQPGLNVYAFTGSTYTGFHAVTDAQGIALFTLPEANYRFRADTHGLQYFSSTTNDCSVPACAAAAVAVPVFGDVTVSVLTTSGVAGADLPVYVFNGVTYTGFSAHTNAQGQAVLTLPQGNYRFRTDLYGAQYFSAAANHCSVPECVTAAITTPVYGQVTVSVSDSAQAPLAGLPVYAFNGSTYTGKSGTTDAQGQVNLILPEGNYRFRTDLNGLQYFSAATNHCSVPECSSAAITAAVFGDVTVTVKDSANVPQTGLPVYVFSGDTYKNFSAVTDANGNVIFHLPEGNYRFRTDLHGAQYFSSTSNTCSVPNCTSSVILTPTYAEVVVTAQSGAGKSQPGLPVYAFNGDVYTGISGVTGADGKTSLWLPEGSYRFRADQFGLEFFSAQTNTCSLPGCTEAVVKTLGTQQAELDQTIQYTYDPLGRLTGATYDDGSFYSYAYDAVGNRLSQTTAAGSDSYAYDAANRLTAVNEVPYSWDANGNLLSDGTRTYSYDSANRLSAVSGADYAYQYVYNGLGDRVQSLLDGTATSYTLDLNNGLTQVLADGTNTYLYGLNRISQVSETQTGTFLGDALGSVRQVVDPEAEIKLMQSYDPYGETLVSLGDYETDYSYTGEMSDQSGLINLRARYYDPGTGRFVSKDTWAGDYKNPVTLIKWLYANGNPIKYSDPRGLCYTDPNIFSKGYWSRFWEAPLLGPCSTNNQYPSNTPTNTPTCTVTPFQSPTLTPTVDLILPIKGNSVISNAKIMENPLFDKNFLLDNQDFRAAGFLAAVELHQSELPNLFSVGLFLAMGYSETGPYYEWNNHYEGRISDGIMQVENGTHAPYTNTLQGIENSVIDAMKLMVDQRRALKSGGYVLPGITDEYQVNGLPHDDGFSNHLIQGLSVLTYNAGFDPIDIYKSGKGNPNYVGTVGKNFEIHVPQLFGYQDSNLALDLIELQARLNKLMYK